MGLAGTRPLEAAWVRGVRVPARGLGAFCCEEAALPRAAHRFAGFFLSVFSVSLLETPPTLNGLRLGEKWERFVTETRGR